MSDRHGWPVLTTSLAGLRAAVRQVTPDNLAAATPCDQWTVGQVVEHAALDQLIWVASVTGGPGPDGNAFAPTGDRDPAAAVAFVASATQAAEHAWSAVGPDDQVATPLPQGPMAAGQAAAAAALDAAVHGWDIAVATGAPVTLDAALAVPLLEVARAIVEPLRQWGAYGPALPDTGDDTGDPVAVLLRYLGRDPQWTPGTP